MSETKKQRPPQKQEQQPGKRTEMEPLPKAELHEYKPGGRLSEKVAIITGGDSGIGRAVAIAFAKEGADIVIVYYNEHEDARDTKQFVTEEGRRCITIAGDVADAEFCRKAVLKTVQAYEKLDILVNNAAVQFPQEKIEDITDEQLERTFRTNILSFFYMTKASLHYLKPGGVIINTSSVTAYRGSSHLIDYSSTKGAITSFTRSLALSLAKRKIRVNGVAPGPVWTPLIPASFDEERVETFGANVPMERAGEPDEIAPCYVFLASGDSSYMTGQILHPNGGEIING